MDDERIKRIVEELDDSVPKEGAEVDLFYKEPGVDIVANKVGFIRLARESLASAIAPLKPGREVVDIEFDYLFGASKKRSTKVSRTDRVRPLPRPPRTRMDKAKAVFRLILVFALLLFLLASVLVGCVTIVGKIAGW